MRKKIVSVLLLSLLLCSCGSQPEEAANSAEGERQQKESISENMEVPDEGENSADVETAENTDVGERIVDVFYQGERSVLTAQAQIVDGKTLRITEASTNTDLLLVWSDDNHFVVQGTGDYLPDLDGMSFSYEENQLYGY